MSIIIQTGNRLDNLDMLFIKRQEGTQELPFNFLAKLVCLYFIPYGKECVPVLEG